ncbi:MAG: PaaI family thioesterase [Thermoanaerobaculia bacterium]|nr:PaaI family thioesterase [Thermoanaerobaculia bacterium]
MPYSEGCFVCGDRNPHGLRLRFRWDGAWVHTRLSVPEQFRGFTDRVHGGVVSALLDEVMGWATVREGGRFSYTGELRVRFRSPVPAGEEIVVRGRVVRHTRRLDFTEAEVRDGDDRLLASADGKFVLLDADASRAVAATLIYTPDAWRPSGASL